MPSRPSPASRATTIVLALATPCAILVAISSNDVPAIEGVVRQQDGTPAAGVFVTATAASGLLAHTVVTDVRGRFELPDVAEGEYEVRAHAAGVTPAAARALARASAAARVELTVAPAESGFRDLPSSALLSLLPDGVDKRRYILDCTGCHLLNDTVALPGGAPRGHEAWRTAVARMLQFAGPQSNFPVIGAGREPAATAGFMVQHIKATGAPAPGRAGSTNAVLTEYPIPAPNDLPHDVAITKDGRVAITGMFTHRMYVLDPGTGEMTTIPIPVQGANPRAVEIDERGVWWVLLGNPMTVARYDPAANEWKTFPIGTYPHSVALGGDGRVWFNGHFTREPELIGAVHGTTGETKTFEVPRHPRATEGAGPIPYELRFARDGELWGSELIGNRVFSFDPSSERFRLYEMPTSHSGPRRLDIGPDGIVWIPQFSANRLARLDPATGEIREIELPVADAVPYVVRVDPRNGVVWIGTSAADALLSYDPAANRFATYRLPTRGAMIRHLAIAPNGDVWAAYGASPGVPSKVARLRVTGRPAG